MSSMKIDRPDTKNTASVDDKSEAELGGLVRKKIKISDKIKKKGATIVFGSKSSNSRKTAEIAVSDDSSEEEVLRGSKLSGSLVSPKKHATELVAKH
jgi:hypothetical protein